MKTKTSLSLNRKTLEIVKREALRQRRSVSQLVEIWIEDGLVPTLAKSNGKRPKQELAA